jgi:hypothetical protein
MNVQSEVDRLCAGMVACKETVCWHVRTGTVADAGGLSIKPVTVRALDKKREIAKCDVQVDAYVVFTIIVPFSDLASDHSKALEIAARKLPAISLPAPAPARQVERWPIRNGSTWHLGGLLKAAMANYA